MSGLKIAVAGLGYVGLSNAVLLSQHNDVTAIDIDPARLAGHFHDTGGRALDNVEVALGHGLRTFDSAIGGLGGCPYAPGAKGNVSTLPLARMLEARGWKTGLDLGALERAEVFMAERIAVAPKRVEVAQ